MTKFFGMNLLLLSLFFIFLNRANGIVRSLKKNSWPHNPEFRIIAGQTAGKYDNPHQAFVGFEIDGKSYQCGGTVIGRRHILTAEHCMEGKGHYVLLGIHDLARQTITQNNKFHVEKFLRYGRHKDIGILQLERYITYSNRISPACIPPQDAEMYVDRKVVISGFGGVVGYLPGQQVPQQASNALLKTELQIKSPSTRLCRRSGANAPDKICAYRKGHDSCQGDSGGPMTIVENEETTVVIGVVSSGKGCAASAYAGVYMRVSYFHDWIKHQVRDVCISQGSSKDTGRCEIGDEGDRGASCTFPFIFNGKSYTGCTLDGVNDGIPWCSTDVDSEGVHVSGWRRWRHCKDSCLQREGGQVGPSQPSGHSFGCEVGDQGDSGATCRFPFIFNGKTYSGCTLDSSPDGIPWCSTSVNRRGEHVAGMGKWRHCQERCLEKQGEGRRPSGAGCAMGDEGDRGASCVFPFILSNGKMYKGCTMDGAPDGKPWCSTFLDRNGVHVPGKWRHCKKITQCLDL